LNAEAYYFLVSDEYTLSSNEILQKRILVSDFYSSKQFTPDYDSKGNIELISNGGQTKIYNTLFLFSGLKPVDRYISFNSETYIKITYTNIFDENITEYYSLDTFTGEKKLKKEQFENIISADKIDVRNDELSPEKLLKELI